MKRANVYAALTACLLVVAAVVAPEPALAQAVYAPITSLVITGPTKIYCPPQSCAWYTVTMTGTGLNPGQSFTASFRVDDNDSPYSPDILQDWTNWTVNGAAGGNWTATTTFRLCCNQAHEIAGNFGSSGETTAEVYVRVAGNITDHISNQLSVTCVTPEPVSFLLAGLGLSAVAAVRRKR